MESKAMAAPYRGDGDVAGNTRVQVTPSNSHVSPRLAGPCPPNRTITFRAESKTIACHTRAGGEAARDFSVHVVPFQTHVPAMDPPLGVAPPNITVWWR